MSAADPLLPRQHIPIPEHETYIPLWYEGHADLDLPVRAGSRWLGFTIREVLPWRRWAIRKDGLLLSQQEFAPLMERYNQMICRRDGKVVPIASVNKFYQPNLEPVPRVERFVAETFDTAGKMVTIAFKKKLDEKFAAVEADPLVEAPVVNPTPPVVEPTVPVETTDPVTPNPVRTAPVDSHGYTRARCGKEVRARGLKMHERQCRRCGQVR